MLIDELKRILNTENIVLDENSKMQLKEQVKDIQALRDMKLSTDEVTKLISLIKDENLVRECIERRKEYGFTPDNISQLINSLFLTRNGRYDPLSQVFNHSVNSMILSKGNFIESIDDKEFLKECIKNSNIYGLHGFDIINIIRKVNEPEYSKKCIEDGVISDPYDVVNLLKELNDTKYIKNYIRSNDRRTNFDTYSMEILIKFVNEVDFTRECIENEEVRKRNKIDKTEDLIISTKNVAFIKEAIENRKRYGIEDSNIPNLIIATHDAKFIKKTIRNREKYGIEDSSIPNLIIETHDVQFIRECISSKDIREEYGIDSPYYICILVSSTNDKNLISEVIRDRQKYGIEEDSIKYLILNLDDREFTKKYVRNFETYGLKFSPKNIYELIESVHEAKFTKECVRNLEAYSLKISSDEIYKLIESVHEAEFTKDCVRNSKTYGLECSSYDFYRLIESVHEAEFTKECVRNLKTYGLECSSYDFCRLIESVQEVKFTEECVKDFKKYNLSSKDICRIVISTKDNGLISDTISKKDEYGLSSDLVFALIGNAYKNLSNEDKIKNFGEIVKYLGDNGLKEKINNLFELTDEDVLLGYWNTLDKDSKKEHLYEFVNSLIDKPNPEDNFRKLIGDFNKDIDIDKLVELLTINDIEFLKKGIINHTLLDYIDGKEVDIDKINSEIDFMHDVFLTSNLPDSFMSFAFFRNHENNYKNTNSQLYAEKISLSDRDKIMQKDLFKIELDSNNRKMRRFLEDLVNGNKALTKFEANEDMSKLDEAILLRYRDTLYSLIKLQGFNLTKTDEYIGDLVKFKEFFHLTKGNDLGERILSNYLGSIGFSLNTQENGNISIQSLIDYMDRIKTNAINPETLQLEEGDLIKGTSIQFLQDFLQNGIRSKEFHMVGSLSSDLTPFDADFSEIKKGNLEEKDSEGNIVRGRNLEETINSTFTSTTYGKTYLVIKRKNYDKDGESSYVREADSKSTRYFRTGMGSSNISAIVTSEWNDEYRFLLATNEFFIPVIDKESGTVLFSQKDYMSIRQQMMGLSYYNMGDYKLDSSVTNPNVLRKAQEIRNASEGKTASNIIGDKINSIVRSKLSQEVVTEMTGDISKKYVEFIDTGSTGRGTNIPGDSDFDYMIKYTTKEKGKELIEKLKEVFKGKDKGGTGEFAIRYKDVGIEGLDEKVDIDVTFERKKLEISYSSDMAVRDRLDSIRRKYGEQGLKTVVDNILVAKSVLKEQELYKKYRIDLGNELGGFGGIGIENWILQNGGSFIRAMQTFLENSLDENGETVPFEEFKKKYPIYDFGQNHRLVKERNSELGDSTLGEHDHFISGLTSEGYTRMQELFRKKLKEYGAPLKISEDIKENDNSREEENHSSFTNSIIAFVKHPPKEYVFTDLSRISGMIARLKTHDIQMEREGEEDIEH